MTRLNNISVFSKEPKFWIYHGGMLSIVIFVQLAISFIDPEESELHNVNVIAITLWSCLYSLAVLAYRFVYLKKRWHELPIGRLMVVSFVFAITASHLLFGVFSAVLYPMFWDDIVASQLRNSPNLTEEKILLRIYISNIFSSTIFMLAWVFLYIGITSARTARESKLDNLRLQNSLKEAQLSSLSNQLNPHFLFNSLNNIRFMIHENAQQADNMITAFSEVLRYSLESSEHEKRPLRNEVDVIKRYIDIVNIQFEERLNFSMSIADDLMEIQVPPMLLQMLIENAVKHGLEQMQYGGDISLMAEPKSGYVEFRVLNDIPQTSAYQSQSTGLGLNNIQQRLHLLYAGQASVDAGRIGDKFQVIICLPM
jgi:sensor histidine kinase YesM